MRAREAGGKALKGPCPNPQLPPRVCYFFFTADDHEARAKRVRLVVLCGDRVMKPLPHADENIWNRPC